MQALLLPLPLPPLPLPPPDVDEMAATLNARDQKPVLLSNTSEANAKASQRSSATSHSCSLRLYICACRDIRTVLFASFNWRIPHASTDCQLAETRWVAASSAVCGLQFSEQIAQSLPFRSSVWISKLTSSPSWGSPPWPAGRQSKRDRQVVAKARHAFAILCIKAAALIAVAENVAILFLGQSFLENERTQHWKLSVRLELLV